MKSQFILLCLNLINSSIIRRDDIDTDYDLTILHTNDIHSRYDQNNKYGTDCTAAQITNKQCYGGLARLKTAVDELRKKHPNNLLFDGGDQFQGTMFYTYYKGDITAKAMNYLNYDIMTIGNHEFDNGPENLARVADSFNFPLVSSNIDATEHPTLGKLVKRYQLYPKYNLAVVGYITYTAPSISNLGKLVKVSDPIESVQKAIDEVNKLGYKRVIAVSHNGYKEDQELASKTKGLSLIVGGHSHTYLSSSLNNVTNAPNSGGLYPTAVKNLDNKNTYVVQAYCWGRFLGHVDIKFNNDGYLDKVDGFPIELNDLVPLDETTNEQTKKWREPFDSFGKVVLGLATGDFEQSTCQSKECSLGSFISDIILDKRPDSDISFINAGGIRAAISKGDIKVSDVLTVLPFGNAVVDIKLSGQQIWDMLEAIVSKVNIKNNKPVTSFIQIGGMKFIYDPSQPAQSRLIKVEVYDKLTKSFVDIKLNKVYTCSTLDFIATGGDNFIAPPIMDAVALEATDAIVSEFIKKHTPVSPYTDGRIKIGKKEDIPSPPPSVIPSYSYVIPSHSYGIPSRSYGSKSYVVPSHSYVVPSKSYGVPSKSYPTGSKSYETGSYKVNKSSYYVTDSSSNVSKSNPYKSGSSSASYSEPTYETGKYTNSYNIESSSTSFTKATERHRQKCHTRKY